MQATIDVLDAQQKVVLVGLEGVPEMDIGSELTRACKQVVADGHQTVILNLTDVMFVPLPALHALQELQEHTSLLIACNHPNIAMLINSTSLAESSTIFDSLDAATTSIHLTIEETTHQPHEEELDIRYWIDSMSDAQKFWYLCALANIVVADGNISPGEISSAEEIFEKIALEEEAIAKIHSIFENLTPGILPEVTVSQELGESLFRSLILIAISDQEMHPDEEGVLHAIGKSLQYDMTQISEFLEWGRQRLYAAK